MHHNAVAVAAAAVATASNELDRYLNEPPADSGPYNSDVIA
jgi:hypothetical protein